MRVYKFRAAASDKHWHKGYLALVTNSYCYINKDKKGVVRCKKRSLCQFIEQVDCNGVELYEQDVILAETGLYKYMLGIITMKNGCFGFVDVFTDQFRLINEFSTSELTKIGDVYHSPDIVEKARIKLLEDQSNLKQGDIYIS